MRQAARSRARSTRATGSTFIEVFVDTPLDECERRDPKGLYAKARAGEIVGMTGVDDAYEAPRNAEVVLRPSDAPMAVDALLKELRAAGSCRELPARAR